MTPPRFEPMLATKWSEPFRDPDWSFEVKWDGVRTLLTWDGAGVSLRSRTNRDVTARYPEFAGFTASVPCVIDGEIVAFDDSGRPSFGRLQGRMNLAGPARVAAAAAAVPVSFVAFDLLFAGTDVTALPWEERRRRLASITHESPLLLADVMAEDGVALWEFVTTRSLEGIVAKRHGSLYRPGIRSSDWRKISRVESVQAVVAGFTPGEGGRSGTFGSLLLGLGSGSALRWIGAVGTGFSDRMLREIRAALDEMTVSECPFLPDPELPREATWVEPVLTAKVEFKEWTGVGRLRAPSFQGFTDQAAALTWEAEGPGSGS